MVQQVSLHEDPQLSRRGRDLVCGEDVGLQPSVVVGVVGDQSARADIKAPVHCDLGADPAADAVNVPDQRLGVLNHRLAEQAQLDRRLGVRGEGDASVVVEAFLEEVILVVARELGDTVQDRVLADPLRAEYPHDVATQVDEVVPRRVGPTTETKPEDVVTVAHREADVCEDGALIHVREPVAAVSLFVVGADVQVGEELPLGARERGRGLLVPPGHLNQVLVVPDRVCGQTAAVLKLGQVEQGLLVGRFTDHQVFQRVLSDGWSPGHVALGLELEPH